MNNRTFFRIMIDNIFLNNPVGRAISTLVNFCNNSTIYNKKNLKFLKKMPLVKKEPQITYDKRFIFDSSYMCGVHNK